MARGLCCCVLTVCLIAAACGTISCQAERPRAKKAEVKSVPKAPEKKDEPMSARVRKRGRAVEVRVHGAGGARGGDSIELLVTMEDPRSKELKTFLLPGPATILEVDGVPGAAVSLKDLTLLVLPCEAEALALAVRFGVLRMLHRIPREKTDVRLSGDAPPRLIDIASLHDKDALEAWQGRRQEVLEAAAYQSAAALPDSRPLSERIPLGVSAVQLEVAGARHVVAGDLVDLIFTLEHPRTGQGLAISLMRALPVLAADGEGSLTFLILPEEAEILTHATRLGSLSASLRRNDDVISDGVISDDKYSWISREILVHGEPPPPCKRTRFVWGGGRGWILPNPDCKIDLDPPPPLDAPEALPEK